MANMMNKQKQLSITHKRAIQLLGNWAEQFQKYDPQLEIRFDRKQPIGTGMTLTSSKNDICQIVIGIENLVKTFPMNQRIIEDSDFIRIGVTLFHERRHYEQYIQSDTKSEIWISEISKYKNMTYYAQSWSELPHEIDAEFTGVMSMWNALEYEYPDLADKCMLSFLNKRAIETDYMLKCSKDGFRSKEQVEIAFESAYDNSLTNPRRFQPNFLRYEDEISRLLSDNSVLRMEYQKHYKELIKDIPGEKKDRRMAALVIHLHPELKEEYPNLNFDTLTIMQEFGFEMPETTEESRHRIECQQTLNDFDKEIEKLSQQHIPTMLI